MIVLHLCQAASSGDGDGDGGMAKTDKDSSGQQTGAKHQWETEDKVSTLNTVYKYSSIIHKNLQRVGIFDGNVMFLYFS